MAKPRASQIWTMRAVFAGLALFLVYARLMPIDNPAGAWGAPDLLLALTFAWGLRRPDYTPPLLVAVLWLVADLLLLRAPGLMTALVLGALMILQARQRDFTDMPFGIEWLAVALAMLALLLAQRAVLGLFLLPPPPMGQGTIQVIVTALVYPVVVLISEYILGVRRRPSGDLDMRSGGLRT